MAVNVFESVLRAHRRKKMLEKRKAATRERNEKIKAKDKELMKELERNKQIENMKRMLRAATDDEYKEKMKKVIVIKRELSTYITGALLQDIKGKMPRSDFAKIRDPKRKVKRTDNLRNSLTSKKGIFTSNYEYELPEGKVPYARKINTHNKYITRGYWGRTHSYVGEQLYQKLKTLEGPLNIKVEKSGKGW